MYYENEIREAARRAERGVDRAIQTLRESLAVDEDDLTGTIKGNLDAELGGATGLLTWKCKILRHRRGIASEERKYGADLLIHVRFDAKMLKYSKGVLVQAKKA